MTDLFDEPSTVFLRRDLLAQGFDDRAIRVHVRAGAWVRIRRGAYVERSVWDAADAAGRHRLQARAVLRTAHPSAALTHVSAALEHEAPTWGVDLSEVHVTRTDGKAGRREAGVVHHCGDLDESEVETVHGVRVTGTARSTIELSTIADVESTLVTANWFLGRTATTVEELAAHLKRFHFWPGSLRKHVLVQLFDGRNAWPGEARTSYLLWRENIPRPEPQYEIRDPSGNLIGIVDFAWPGLGVFLEFDGRIKYERLRREGETLEDVIRREKRREEQICAMTGWVCIRITWEDLARPATVALRIRAILASRAPRVG
jgi:hypothetical protein